MEDKRKTSCDKILLPYLLIEEAAFKELAYFFRRFRGMDLLLNNAAS